jgi:hypothetical protein
VRKQIISFLFVFVFTAGLCFAGIDFEFDITAQPPVNETYEYDWGMGLSAGLSVDLFAVTRSTLLQARSDFSWFFWNNVLSDYIEERNYDRFVLFAGLRIMIPLFGGSDSCLGIFGDAGGEVSWDQEFINGPYVDDEYTRTATTFGGVVGGGIFAYLLIFPPHGWFTWNASVRYHIIDDAFLSIGWCDLGLRFDFD